MFIIRCNRTGMFLDQMTVGRSFFIDDFVLVENPLLAWRLCPPEAYALLTYLEFRSPGRFSIDSAPAVENK